MIAGQQGDHGVARRGVERRRAQQRAGPEPPGETRAMELVVSPGDRADVSDTFGEGLADDFRRRPCASARPRMTSISTRSLVSSDESSRRSSH